MEKYLMGFTTTVIMERKQLVEDKRNCSLLEKSISSFLLRRRARRERLDLYLISKREERARNIATYEEIRKLMNEM